MSSAKPCLVHTCCCLRFQQGSFYCSSVSQSYLDVLNKKWGSDMKASRSEICGDLYPLTPVCWRRTKLVGPHSRGRSMADSAKRESPSPDPRQPTDPQSCMQQVAPRLRGRQLGSIQGLRGDLQVAAGKCPLVLALGFCNFAASAKYDCACASARPLQVHGIVSFTLAHGGNP